jgi:hypothetical protein
MSERRAGYRAIDETLRLIAHVREQEVIADHISSIAEIGALTRAGVANAERAPPPALEPRDRSIPAST